MASSQPSPRFPGRPEVRKAELQEAGKLARALAKAFDDDPIAGWILSDDSQREEAMRRGFDLYLRRIFLRHEETYSIADTAGVCIWAPPGTWKLEPREQLRLLAPMLRIYGRRLPRLLRTIAAAEKSHPAKPHYYLAFLGVRPESQGRGLGSMLMHPVLERCDAEAIPAYLESSSARSRALYERHGFEVTGELRAGRGCPPMWLMWREPR